MTRIEGSLRRDALGIFRAALAAADARQAVRNQLRLRSGNLVAPGVRLPLRNFDRIFLLAVGKAAAQMAAGVDDVLGAFPEERSLIVTKHGHAAKCRRTARVFEAGHPVPDEESVRAAYAVRELLQQLNARDLLVVAVSGGASALLVAPCNGISLEHTKQTTGLLLRAGADIGELNAVRKHLSLLKGGGLAALAYPATVLNLCLSDVIGDRLDVIGSGLAVPDSSTFADALGVLQRYGLTERVPAAVHERLRRGAIRAIPETPKPGDPLFENVHHVVAGSNTVALEAARREARRRGYRTLVLSTTLAGEAREIARVHGQILAEIRRSGQPLRPPACVLSGGEPTVTLRGAGKGGRNQEFALAAAIELKGLHEVLALSAGTDGTDGPTPAAGALATGTTVSRARKAGLDPADFLLRNDSYSFFQALGDLVTTGPTGTNVMDVHILLAG